VSVTGLGGTEAEPGIEPTAEAMGALESILERVSMTPDRICLRIDPLQAWHGQGRTVTNADRVDGILQRAHAMGIRRARVSPAVLTRYAARILPRARRRGLQSQPVDWDKTGPSLRFWMQQGMDLRSCACDLEKEGVPPGACFDFAWVTGSLPAGPLKTVAARSGCLCVVPDGVRVLKVPRRSVCSGGCLACYAQDHSD